MGVCLPAILEKKAKQSKNCSENCFDKTVNLM